MWEHQAHTTKCSGSVSTLRCEIDRKTLEARYTHNINDGPSETSRAPGQLPWEPYAIVLRCRF